MRIARSCFYEASAARRLIIKVEVDELLRPVIRRESEITVDIVGFEILKHARSAPECLDGRSRGDRRRWAIGI